MKGKKLIALGIVAVVLVGLAVVSQKKNTRNVAPSQVGKKVMPELAVNDVSRIVVTSPSATATVERVDGTWISPDTHGFPVDFAKVRGMLIKLSELKVGQAVASLSDRQRQSLKMLDPGVSGTNGGTLVELYGSGDEPIASLLLGAAHERRGDPALMGGSSFPDGRYVSPDGGTTVCLVSETLDNISATPHDWLASEIVNVPAADVTKLAVAVPGTEPLHFSIDGSDLVLDGLAEDEEMDSSKSWTLKSGLNYLRFEDVADPSLSDEALGMTNAAAYTVTTKNGEIYKALIGGSPEGSENRYFRIAAELSPAAETSPPEDETDEQKAAREKAAAERTERQTTIDEFNSRVKPWTFVIAKYEAESLLLTRDGVVKAKEKTEENKKEPAAKDASGE